MKNVAYGCGAVVGIYLVIGLLGAMTSGTLSAIVMIGVILGALLGVAIGWLASESVAVSLFGVGIGGFIGGIVGAVLDGMVGLMGNCFTFPFMGFLLVIAIVGAVVYYVHR